MNRLFWGFFLACTLSAWAATCQVTPTQAKVPPLLPESYRFVFVVDTSGSMMGRGDGKAVIFPKVQQELLRFFRTLPPGSEVVLVPFHQGPQGEARFRFPEERAQAEAYVRRLQANGQNTWIYRTLVRLLEGSNQKPGLATAIYIFTDGVDNDRTGPYRMRDVVERLKLKQGPYDWVYYVALGVEVPREVRQGLGSLPRTRIEEAQVGEVPRLGAYTVKPTVLRLGNLKLNPVAEVPLLLEAQGSPGPLRLRVEDAALQEKGAFLQVEPKTLSAGSHTLRFRLQASSPLPDGTYTLRLCLEAPQGTVLRPEVLRVELAYHPPATYRLVPLEVPPALTLGPGQSAVLRYRLEGNPWAQEPLVLEAGVPKGLEARINGQEGPVSLRPGEEAALTLANQGLAPGTPVTPTLKAQAPAGAQVEALPSLPSVTQPITWLDRLRQLWWLWLLLLLLLGGLVYYSRRGRGPWGDATLISPPPECEEIPLSLKGRVDLGKTSGREALNRVELEHRQGKAYLVGLPPGFQARASGLRVQENESLQKGEVLELKEEATGQTWTLRLDWIR